MNHTTNLNLNKPETTERALISDINENMDIIDSAIGKVKVEAETSTITDTELAEVFEGVIVGLISSAIHGTADTYGAVRAYTLSEGIAMQIAEFTDGTRLTRNYASDTWSAWS